MTEKLMTGKLKKKKMQRSKSHLVSFWSVKNDGKALSVIVGLKET